MSTNNELPSLLRSFIVSIVGRWFQDEFAQQQHKCIDNMQMSSSLLKMHIYNF